MTPTPPFNSGDEVLCIKNAPEVNLDNSSPTILGEDEEGWPTDIVVGSICPAGSTYKVDCCIWSPYTGWIAVIGGEFHKADCFQLV